MSEFINKFKFIQPALRWALNAGGYIYAHFGFWRICSLSLTRTHTLKPLKLLHIYILLVFSDNTKTNISNATKNRLFNCCFISKIALSLVNITEQRQPVPHTRHTTESHKTANTNAETKLGFCFNSSLFF